MYIYRERGRDRCPMAAVRKLGGQILTQHIANSKMHVDTFQECHLTQKKSFGTPIASRRASTNKAAMIVDTV